MAAWTAVAKASLPFRSVSALASLPVGSMATQQGTALKATRLRWNQLPRSRYGGVAPCAASKHCANACAARGGAGDLRSTLTNWQG